MKNFFPYYTSVILCFLVQATLTLFAQPARINSTELLIQIKKEMDVQKNYKYAFELCKKGIHDHPGDVDFLFLYGKACLLNHDSSKAKNTVEKVLKRDPHYKDAYLLAANIELIRKNDHGAMEYVTKGLSRFPKDRDLSLKRLNILESGGSYWPADTQAGKLLQLFPQDPVVLRVCIDYYNNAGAAYLEQGNYTRAANDFDKVLEISHGNREALKGNLEAKARQGDNGNSLSTINRALNEHPGSHEFLMKKVALLQKMKRYPEALETLKELQKRYPADAKARSLETELRLEAARYYKSTDPYYQYQGVLEKAPGNREALNNAIEMSISHEQPDEAMALINKALKKNPSDRALMTRKMELLRRQQKYIDAALIAERLQKLSPGNAAARETMIELDLQAAGEYARQQLYDNALELYDKILNLSPRQQQARNGAISILSTQQNYTAALKQIDQGLLFAPDDEQLLFRKAGILQQTEQYEEASVILEKLINKDPKNSSYRNALIETDLARARLLMQGFEYDRAAEIYYSIFCIQPNQKEALNGLINAELAKNSKGSETALRYAQAALNQYPNDKDFQLKKSESLFRLHRYPEAYAITESLHRKYPFDPKIKGVYVEQLFTEARSLRHEGKVPEALQAYRNVLKANPTDTLAYLDMINLYSSVGKTDSALVVSNRAVTLFPQNMAFRLKRATILEQKKCYREAAAAVDSLSKSFPVRVPFPEYAAYLQSMSFKNQIGLSYLNSRIDSTQSANFATIQYSYFGAKATYTGRVNFAGRATGAGFQLEFETYCKHNSKWISFFSTAIANQIVFPRWKTAYSIFHNFEGGWEGELGARFLNSSTFSAFSTVASASKYLGDFWFNLRDYTTFTSGKTYSTLILTGRQYLNDKTDFFSTTMGYGNSPDDFSRSFQLKDNLEHRTYSIGAGYQKLFDFRNIVNFSVTWYNQKTAPGKFRNQYDLYITLLRKF